MSIVFLNGKFLPVESAAISPLDRGFIFGDGVYEMIPVYGRRPFRLTEHLQRLEQSLAGVRISAPYRESEWAAILDELISRHESADQSVYLQVTRGVAKRDHGFPRDCVPTVFAMSSPLAGIGDDVRRHGVSAITLRDTRWENCHLKTISLLPNILLRQQALDQDAVEAILIRDGEITEGAASNVFAVHDGVLMTPPKGPRLLPGITRDLILELADDNGIAHREDSITIETLVAADEIWLTSSTREILPVTRLNGSPVGDGMPGPLWTRMIALYQEYKRSLSSASEALRG